MYHVLLPVDAEVDRARRAAQTVANLSAAGADIQVTVLNVQPEVELSAGDGSHVSSADWYDPENLPESVSEVRTLLEGGGIEVAVRREHADPAQGIIDVSDEEAVDMIVMSGRKTSPVGKVLFGSVTQSVLLSADVPVTVAAMN
jgi:nucleotide-binding universal stress UspA family protein